MTTATQQTVGESDEVVVKYEPFRFNGQSHPSILMAHSYGKYLRVNPNKPGQASAHGGTSRYAHWKLHAVNGNLCKLQNHQTGNYLRIINKGATVDCQGSGGQFTLFKVIQHNVSSNNMVQPHMLSLESVQFPGHFVAVDGQMNVYSFTHDNTQNRNKNDLFFYLFAKPNMMNDDVQMEQKQQSNAKQLQPGVVVIQHAFNQHVRVQPGQESQVNANGGRGHFARWQLEIHGQNLVKFKSTKSGKYLRIIKNGSHVDSGGTGGQFTLFRYDPLQRTLESNKFPGCFLAMNASNKSNVFAVYKASDTNANYLYQFNIIPLDVAAAASGEIVVIQHAFGKHLRVKPGDESKINGHGGRGKFARWQIERFDNGQKIKLKSTKSGRYLRIIKNGSMVDVGGSGGQFTLFKWNKQQKTLESNKFPGFYLAVNQQDNTVISVQQESAGVSMKFDIITLPKNAGNHHAQRQNGYQFKYNFNALQQNNSTQNVVIRSQNNGKSVRVKPGQLEVSNCLGGFGQFAHWKLSNHGCGIFKVQSCKTGKYLRISPKHAPDVRGTGGIYTQFRVHLVSDCHVIRLESVVFPHRYLAVNMNGEVYVYHAVNGINNNQECVFQVWSNQNNGGNNMNMNVGQMANNGMDQSAVIESQKQIIEQQKILIDQLQRTVQSQQVMIQNLQQQPPQQRQQQPQAAYGQHNAYPDLAPRGYHANDNQNGTTDGGEYDEESYEYVPNPGSTQK